MFQSRQIPKVPYFETHSFLYMFLVWNRVPLFLFDMFLIYARR
nr:MAG TPA: hypothetical protein [Caudoviricetes sp.]